jgi:hypothetical protein
MTPYPKALERFPTIRQSRLAAYDRCPRSALLDAEYGAEWSSAAQARGQIMHRVFAEAMRSMHRQGERKIPPDQAIEILYDKLRMADVDTTCPTCEAPVEWHEGLIVCAQGHSFRGDFTAIPLEEVKDMRWTCVKWANDTELDIDALADIEHRLTATVEYPDSEGGKVERRLTGQLDALFVFPDGDDEHAVVLDWKDTWQIPGESEPGWQGFFQQRFYGFLVMANYPAVQTVTLREHYVRKNVFREWTVYRYELEDLKREFSALAERFDRSWHEGMFPPQPGAHCTYCARPSACPIFPAIREEIAITNDATARRVGHQAVVAKAVLKKHEQALKDWASLNGDVVVNSTAGRERVWGFVDRKSTSRPTKDELEKQVFLHGGRFSPDSLYHERVQTRFELHSPRPVDPEPEDERLEAALDESLRRMQQGKVA